MAIQLNDLAPDFSLPGVDGKTYTLQSFIEKDLLCIVFSCNHCPYVQAYEERMVNIQREFGKKSFQLIAINSNEDKHYPEDSFEKMITRAKEKGFNFPYLRDKTQKIAKTYGATRTPHIFLFDQNRRLGYAGAIDDNWNNPQKVNKRYLHQAIEAMLTGQTPPVKETLPVGCSIKWLQGSVP